MANLKSSKKNVRRIARATERNRKVRSKLKTLRKAALSATTGTVSEKAPAIVKELIAASDKAAKTKVIHRNKANRLKARMAKRLAAGKQASA